MSANAYNLYDTVEYPAGFESKFSNTHLITHTNREFFLTFGIAHPPKQKITPVAQLILTRDHAVELVLNLQAQIKQFDEKTKGSV
jgi:hypothetical protein